MELEDLLDKKQHDKAILKTPLFDRLCADDDCVNSRISKDAMVSMIVDSMCPYLGRLIYGSLVYPEKYHRNNLTTDLHHFLRQVFQRCQPLSWKDQQLKRVFFEEIKDDESPHSHFIMETPREMNVPEFINLCESRWNRIATRNRRHAKQMNRLKKVPTLSPRYPKIFLVRDGKPCIRQVESQTAINPSVLAENPRWEGLGQVKPVVTLEHLTKYSLKWMTSTDTRFSSNLILGSSKPSIRGHRTELVLL
ncbi:MAG: hypothetical protein Nkreftii_000589 [Candidatus Nitrospira kreftii]|uniref:Uncharacterized protein n=1 Tax=Candidatus Nitrospira kreftii TaxID=2652173 RepID=A0A7S8FBK4_9BACT|nr:MAG: hypothetical protein Nkreftii_000589 [Candidatus Nitrospira kreftii]